jgi:hypothetical protein
LSNHVSRTVHPLDIACELRIPERQLQSERHWLGVNAVRASHHRCAAVLFGSPLDGRARRAETGEDDVARFAHLNRLRGIDDVG